MKPRLSICMISNRPDDVIGFIQSMDTGWYAEHRERVQLCLSYQSPVAGRIREIETVCRMHGYDFVAEEREFSVDGLFHYGAAREHAWSMATGGFAYIVDDDCRFGSGTPANNYRASKRIFDAIDFIGVERRVVQLNGFLGSNAALQTFVPMNRGLWSVNHGLILRRFDGPLIRPELLRPGACEDLSIFASLFSHGWQPYKGFRSMINIRPTTKIGLSRNPNYNVDYLLTKGNIAAVREHYPNFQISKKLWSPK